MMFWLASMGVKARRARLGRSDGDRAASTVHPTPGPYGPPTMDRLEYTMRHTAGVMLAPDGTSRTRQFLPESVDAFLDSLKPPGRRRRAPMRLLPPTGRQPRRGVRAAQRADALSPWGPFAGVKPLEQPPRRESLHRLQHPPARPPPVVRRRPRQAGR
jgi:hypothetical protein